MVNDWQSYSVHRQTVMRNVLFLVQRHEILFFFSASSHITLVSASFIASHTEYKIHFSKQNFSSVLERGSKNHLSLIEDRFIRVQAFVAASNESFIL